MQHSRRINLRMTKFYEMFAPQNIIISTPENKSFELTTKDFENIHEKEFKGEFRDMLASVVDADTRYVITHYGKPIAALVPIVDHQMLIDYVQHEVEPCRWVELVNDTRIRLGYDPVIGE